jgi:hypothetical protein
MEKIYRNLYRGAVSTEYAQSFCEKAAADSAGIRQMIESGKLLGLSLYMWKQYVFLYYETIDCVMDPYELLTLSGGELESWPGGEAVRKWIPLIDIFHFNEPAGIEHWKRKSPVEAHLGKIGILKPDRIQNYVFYHYALQEERAFGGDKYQIIGINENILFAYMESPTVQEVPVTDSKLKTKVVPENWADAGISASFIPWEDRIGTPEERLRNMGEIISVW